MEIKVYLHRTKKKNFEVADCFSVHIDFDKYTQEEANDVEFMNEQFKTLAQNRAFCCECIRKFGTGYISFMRPQYEGPEKENGNETIYFDNKEMLFKLKSDKEEENE